MRIIPIWKARSKRAPAPEARFRIHVSDGRRGIFAIEVYDRARRQKLTSWQGSVARHLIQTGAIPDDAAPSFLADKSVVSELVMGAAAFAMTGERETPACLAERLKELRITLSDAEFRLARLMFEYPDQHLSREDVICLFSLRYPAIDGRAQGLLERLAERGVIQKIEVDPDNVFFDLDTRRHAHIFEGRTRRLYDAPSSGVIHAA